MKRLLLAAILAAGLGAAAGSAVARDYSPRIAAVEKLAESGDFAGAVKAAQAVAADAEKSGDKLLLAEASGSLGGAMIGIGQMAEAEPFLKRAWTIREELLGPDDPRTLYAVNDYGVWLSIQGRDNESEALLGRAARGLTATAKTPSEQADAAEARAGHAMALFALGQWTLAESQMISAIKVLETRPDKGVSTLNAVTILADSYLAWGRYEDARRTAETALAMREKAMGPNHPHAVGVLVVLGQSNLSLGDHAAAERYYLRGVEVTQAAFPNGGPYVSHALNALANFYASTNRQEEAVAIYRRAAEANEKAGDQSWRAAEGYRMMAQTMSAMGRGDEAVAPAEKALALYEGSRGPASEQAAAARLTLARIAYDRGDVAAGEKYAREGLAIYEKILSPDNPRLADPLGLVARGAQKRGDHAEAARLYARAVEAGRKARPAYHPSLTTGRANLGQQMMLAGGDPAAAWGVARTGASDLQRLALANARLVGRGGAPNLTDDERDVFYVAVRTAWGYSEALKGKPAGDAGPP